MPAPDVRARSCLRCGALNDASFERCVRCAAPLKPLAAGLHALERGIDANALWGTKVIVGLTLLVFAGQLASMLGSGQRIRLMSGGSDPDLLRFGAMPISIEDVAAEPFRLLSAVFVHFGVLHVALNMLGLASMGRVVEPGVGTSRFVVAYLVCGVLGFATNLGVEAIFPDRGVTPVLTAGASGAVFGAMGILLGWLVQRRDRRWRSIAIQAAFYAVIVNLMGLGINNGAHLGGLFCGVAFGIYYAARPRPRSLLIPNVGAIVGLVLSVVSLVLAQRSMGP